MLTLWTYVYGSDPTSIDSDSTFEMLCQQYRIDLMFYSTIVSGHNRTSLRNERVSGLISIVLPTWPQ